jgi:hypothetical protein
MKVVVIMHLSKKEIALLAKGQLCRMHGCPLIFQFFLSELAPSAGAVVVEVSQGRSLHLSG